MKYLQPGPQCPHLRNVPLMGMYQAQGLPWNSFPLIFTITPNCLIPNSRQQLSMHAQVPALGTERQGQSEFTLRNVGVRPFCTQAWMVTKNMVCAFCTTSWPRGFKILLLWLSQASAWRAWPDNTAESLGTSNQEEDKTPPSHRLEIWRPRSIKIWPHQLTLPSARRAAILSYYTELEPPLS